MLKNKTNIEHCSYRTNTESKNKNDFDILMAYVAKIFRQTVYLKLKNKFKK